MSIQVSYSNPSSASLWDVNLGAPTLTPQVQHLEILIQGRIL